MQFQEDAIPPFGGPLLRLSVPGRHINSNKNCDSWLYLTAGSLLGAWLCRWEYADPARSWLFAQLFPNRTLLQKRKHWMNIYTQMWSSPWPFTIFVFSSRNNSSTGWETLPGLLWRESLIRVEVWIRWSGRLTESIGLMYPLCDFDTQAAEALHCPQAVSCSRQAWGIADEQSMGMVGPGCVLR